MINSGDMAGPHYAIVPDPCPCLDYSTPLDFTEAAGRVESTLEGISSEHSGMLHLPNDYVLPT